MKTRILASGILTAAALLGAVHTDAQTCRVAAGVSPDGCRTFLEVYEYDFVSIKPSFPGGDDKLMEYINSERRYPREAYRKKIQGRVTCSFVICADGSVGYVRVLKGVEPTLNEEAVRILSGMPDWQPGRVDGQPVPVRVIRTVPFRR